jgi:tetrahydromethanopterin S-methyltransferase subunit A
MKFSAIALIGATAALETAENLNDQAAQHYRAGVVEIVDTVGDVAKIHATARQSVHEDFKSTLQKEKTFWAKGPAVW